MFVGSDGWCGRLRYDNTGAWEPDCKHGYRAKVSNVKQAVLTNY